MRAGHPVVAVVGGVALVLFGSVAVRIAEALESGDLEVFDAVPAETTLRMAVGESKQFSVWVRGEGLHYQWLLDGGSVGDRHSWTFVPRATDVGFHLVTAVVDGPDGRVQRSWRVQVDATPSAAPSTVAPATIVPATLPPRTVPPATVTPATTSTTSTSTSTSSTAPTARATTTSTTTTTRRPTTTTTRRPTTTTTRRPTTTTTVRPTTTTTVRPTTTSTEAPAPPPTAPRTTTTVPRAGAITEGEVRALFERYKAAWRNHDIDALEAVGQVATQGQADALKSYFESVRDLDVDVTILGITLSGDEARVRFIRRDRFRDPGGSMVTKESPVIEKSIVRTPGGLRLAPPR